MKLTHEAFLWLRDQIVGMLLSTNCSVLTSSARKFACEGGRNCLAPQKVYLFARRISGFPTIIQTLPQKASRFTMARWRARYFNYHAWQMDRYHSIRDPHPGVSQWSIFSICRHRLGLCGPIWYSTRLAVLISRAGFCKGRTTHTGRMHVFRVRIS